MRRFAGWLLATALVCTSAGANAPAEFESYRQSLTSRLAALAQENVQRDPALALDFVRTRTVFEAYRGQLRGAEGAFATARGNSVDRALLLQQVLQPEKSRFARCTLDDTAAASLAATERPSEAVTLAENAARLAEGDAPVDVKAYLTALAASWQGLTQELTTESGALAAAVEAAGVSFAGGDLAAAKRAAAADHVWLQVEREGAWLDLDPDAAGGPGAVLCAAATQFETIPDELRHRVLLEVTAELRGADGATTRRTLLTHTADAAALAFDDVNFYFSEALGGDTPADAAALESGAFAYTPLLEIGQRRIEGTPLLLAAPKSGFGAIGDAAAKGVGGAIDLLGGMGPEPKSEPAPAAPRLEEEPLAAFLVVTYLSPGMPPASASGMLFDRVGDAARLSLATDAPLRDLAETEGDYAELARVWTIGLLTGAISDRPAASSELALRHKATDGRSELSALVRGFESAEAALLRTAGLQVLTTHARPRLLLFGIGATGQGKAARIAIVADLAASGIEDAPDARESAAHRAVRAVARVLAERVTTGLAGLPLPGTAALVEPQAGPDLVALSKAARAQRKALGTGPAAFDDADANALANAQVAAGNVLLLPTGSVRVAGAKVAGWWVADPRAGLLYDELGNGRSSTSGETAGQLERTRKSVPAWRRYGCTIRSVVLGASLTIGLAAFMVDPASGANTYLTLAEEMHAAEAAAEAAAKEAASSSAGSAGCGGVP